MTCVLDKFDLFFHGKKIRASIRTCLSTRLSQGDFNAFEICYWHLHQLLCYSLQTIENLSKGPVRSLETDWNVHREWGCSSKAMLEWWKAWRIFFWLQLFAEDFRGPIFQPGAIFEGSLSHTHIAFSKSYISSTLCLLEVHTENHILLVKHERENPKFLLSSGFAKSFLTSRKF